MATVRASSRPVATVGWLAGAGCHKGASRPRRILFPRRPGVVLPLFLLCCRLLAECLGFGRWARSLASLGRWIWGLAALSSSSGTPPLCARVGGPAPRIPFRPPLRLRRAGLHTTPGCLSSLSCTMSVSFSAASSPIFDGLIASLHAAALSSSPSPRSPPPPPVTSLSPNPSPPRPDPPPPRPTGDTSGAWRPQATKAACAVVANDVMDRAIYNMCTHKLPQDYSQQLYDKYRKSFEEYITSMCGALARTQLLDWD